MSIQRNKTDGKEARTVEVIIKGSANEIAALVQELQGRQDLGPCFVPETAEKQCLDNPLTEGGVKAS